MSKNLYQFICFLESANNVNQSTVQPERQKKQEKRLD